MSSSDTGRMVNSLRKNLLPVLLSTLISVPAMADPAMDWVQKMSSAMRNLNYRGDFVYLHDNQLESMRISHYTDENGEKERLISLNAAWMIKYANADKDRVEQVKDAILEQRRREQLIFARWAMVMLHFEKAMYENPDQDLNKLWYDYVERFQFLKRPQGSQCC